MNEEFLIEVLRNKDAILKEIDENIKMLLLSAQLEENETEEIRSFYLPKPTASWGKGTSSKGRQSDLSDLYESFEKNRLRKKREMKQLLNRLLKQREDAERVWACYLVLPHAQQKILKMYYVDGRKLEDIACEQHVSVKTVFNHRNAALNMLRESVESGLSPETLFLTGQKGIGRRTKTMI